LVKPRCFVIMPFAAEMDSVYRIIKETVEQHGVECKRADERYLSEPILDEVKAQIDSADLVIVDFTGQNSNVYFEAGMANALTKKWIILAQSKKDLAFDVKHIRAIMYLDKMGYEQKFRDDLHHAIEETLVMIGQGSKVSFSCPLTSLQNVVTS
jgi:nucleoside 2-deoxyribosyltransferase